MKKEVELKDLTFAEKSKMNEEFEIFCNGYKFKGNSFLVFIAYMQEKYYFVPKLIIQPKLKGSEKE